MYIFTEKNKCSQEINIVQIKIKKCPHKTIICPHKKKLKKKLLSKLLFTIKKYFPHKPILEKIKDILPFDNNKWFVKCCFWFASCLIWNTKHIALYICTYFNLNFDHKQRGQVLPIYMDNIFLCTKYIFYVDFNFVGAHCNHVDKFEFIWVQICIFFSLRYIFYLQKNFFSYVFAFRYIA